MVALELANSNLFRIVVPRPLLLQSAQIMQTKLGGLLDRKVIHIPFSRKTPTEKALMQTYCRLHTNLRLYSLRVIRIIVLIGRILLSSDFCFVSIGGIPFQPLIQPCYLFR